MRKTSAEVGTVDVELLLSGDVYVLALRAVDLDS